MLGKSVDKHWAKWAYDMLLAGFETEELIILASEHAPFNQFESQRLTDKIFIGLDLTFENKKVAYSNYTCYLLDRSLAGKSRPEAVLRKLSELYTEEYEDLFQDIYLLYWAQYDLQYSDNQYYWDGATRSKIHQVISEYFATWLVQNGV